MTDMRMVFERLEALGCRIIPVPGIEWYRVMVPGGRCVLIKGNRLRQIIAAQRNNDASILKDLTEAVPVARYRD
ncbi:MAG: hypothetical protein H0Z39_03855 [Peptococcaceae bacterium]|nr:hypothetical protein [Peptococcaceae bacterium]